MVGVDEGVGDAFGGREVAVAVGELITISSVTEEVGIPPTGEVVGTGVIETTGFWVGVCVLNLWVGVGIGEEFVSLVEEGNRISAGKEGWFWVS